MRYQSIIRFLEYAHIEYASPETFHLARARKLVNAEFAMQADGMIAINQFSYTKQDVLAELEHSDFIQRLDNHKRIWENPSLLDLLERDKIDLSQTPSWFQLAYAPNFKSFVSPYFASVFDRIIRALYTRNNLYNAAIWLDYFQFIDSEQQEEALRSTRLYLADVTKFFKNLNDASYKTRAAELALWHTSNWSLYINKLPDSLLGYVDEVISAMINFTVRLQKSDRTICFNLSKEMLLVNNANYSLRQLVRSNHESYKQNYESRTVKGYFSKVNYIYVIIVVLFWVARFAMGNTSDDSGASYKFRPLTVFNKQQIPGIKPEPPPLYNAEKEQFLAQRAAYVGSYDSLRGQGFPAMSPAAFSKVAFLPEKIYVLIEGYNSDTTNLDSIGFENGSSKTVTVDIFWQDNVYHHTLEPKAYIGFRAAVDKNLDVMLSFRSIKDSSRTSLPVGVSSQYMHIRGKAGKPFVDISDAFGSPDEMPYLLHSQLREMPVFIKIKEVDGKIYFDLQGKGMVLNAHSAVQ